jgi:hypothetical protein
MFGALWVLFVDTVFDTSANTVAALLTQLAYPVMDAALLAVAARLAVILQLKHPPIAHRGRRQPGRRRHPLRDLQRQRHLQNRNADVAMYLSKSRGKGRFEFFEPAMHEEAIERLDQPLSQRLPSRTLRTGFRSSGLLRCQTVRPTRVAARAMRLSGCTTAIRTWSAP